MDCVWASLWRPLGGNFHSDMATRAALILANPPRPNDTQCRPTLIDGDYVINLGFQRVVFLSGRVAFVLLTYLLLESSCYRWPGSLMVLFCSVAVLYPRVGHAHHGRTFSIYPCPLSF